MSALPNMSHAESAAAYERHISDNWDALSPFEQEQARAYLQSKFQAMQQPHSPQVMTSMYQQPGYPNASPTYGMYGGFAPAKPEQGGGWAVPVGYVGLLVFTPLAFFCGIYLMTKGRSGHGIAQILLSAALFLFTFMLLTMP